MKNLTIGKVAQLAGIGIETIRFYERNGILLKPDRLPSGYRVYDSDTIKRIKFIKDAKELGFTLEEIKEFLNINETPVINCGTIKKKISNKIKDIEVKITNLLIIKACLTEISNQCKGNQTPLNECGFLKKFYSNHSNDD